MSKAREHYDDHLADIYTWMAGGAAEAIERNRNFFLEIGINDAPRGLAIDLGCGSGFQSIPLAELGFSVMAVDFSSALLNELSARAGNLPIRTINEDILNFSRHIDQKARLIVCMGDTLTHLKTLDEVRKLLFDASRALENGGILVFTFRDYISAELEGAERFIPVRSDVSRILTCFLDYRENQVEVYDLLYKKKDTHWEMKISSYPKLRLDQLWLIEQLQILGFNILFNELSGGVIKIVSQKIYDTARRQNSSSDCL